MRGHSQGDEEGRDEPTSTDHAPPDDSTRVANANLRVLATFLVDGMVSGVWRIERGKTAAALVLDPFGPLSRSQRAELTEEGTALVRFVESDAPAAEVRFG